MKLERRLLLHGVVLPSLLMAATLVAVGTLLWAQLLRGVDRSLRAQATAESVSLFDGPDGQLHFHAATSPLRSTLGRADAEIAIYDAQGRLLEASDRSIAPERIEPPNEPDPTLRTVEGARELRLRLTGPSGAPYVLRLAKRLDEEKDTMADYARSAALGLLAFVALLALLQRQHVRWLTRRVGALAAHMQRIRDGDLASSPEEDSVPDVIGQLRDSVAVATEQLREMRRAREHFVAGAAHELRTPLAAMAASVDIALRRERSNAELRRTLQEIRREIARLDALATELLDLASVGAREHAMVPTDIAELARQSARRFAATAESKEVTIAVNTKGPCVRRVVPDLLARALDNLVSNALRYAPPGSTVQITVEGTAERATLRVSDAGPGFPREALEAAFTPFHRLDFRGEGRGLGLALVREVAELHGGTARAVPTDTGATVEVSLFVAPVR